MKHTKWNRTARERNTDIIISLPVIKERTAWVSHYHKLQKRESSFMLWLDKELPLSQCRTASGSGQDKETLWNVLSLFARSSVSAHGHVHPLFSGQYTRRLSKVWNRHVLDIKPADINILMTHKARLKFWGEKDYVINAASSSLIRQIIQRKNPADSRPRYCSR